MSAPMIARVFYGVGFSAMIVGIVWIFVVGFFMESTASPVAAFITFFVGMALGLIGVEIWGVKIRREWKQLIRQRDAAHGGQEP